MDQTERLASAWAEQRQRFDEIRVEFDRLGEEGDALTAADRWQRAEPARLEEFDRAAMRASHRFVTELLRCHELRQATHEAFGNAIPEPIVQTMHDTSALLGPAVASEYRLHEQGFASEMGQRFSDPTGARIDSALRDWQVWAPGHEHREALRHVLTRRPRRGPESRWREVLRTSKPEGLYHWIHKAVRLNVKDRGREAPRPVLPQAAVLALVAHDKLSRREREILRARLLGEPIAERARRLGISPSTARTLLQRASRKLRSGAKKPRL